MNVADLEARLDAALAHVERLEAEVNGVKVQVTDGGDSVVRWIAAAGAWIIYPLVWRPLRRWRQKRNWQSGGPSHGA